MNDGILRHGRLGAGLALALLAGGLWGAALALVGAREADPAPAQSNSTQTVSLEYQPLAFRLAGWQLKITPRAVPFRQEPFLASTNVGRGVIQSTFRVVEVSDAPVESSIGTPFLWDYTAGRLYLDLNRSEDLAHAPLFQIDTPSPTELRRGKYYYQAFTNIGLTFRSGADAQPRLVDIHLYGYHGQEPRGGNLTWRNVWQGRVSLQDHDWQIGLVEDPNHLHGPAGARLLLRPWSERDQPFSLEDGSLNGFAFPTNLFFHDRAYRLALQFLTAPAPHYRLELAPLPAELGELVVQGQFIDRLLLCGQQAPAPWTVVLDSPGGSMRIPVGLYDPYRVFLKTSNAAAFRSYRSSERVKPLISARQPTVLRAGGPLTNWVTLGHQGRTLSLDYQLLGADGPYTLLGNNRTNPILFSISQAGLEVASGRFEYG